jgi:hypothetical protein
MPYTAQQLSDLEDIRNATLRYSRGVDRLDAELMKSAYWPDAIDHHGEFKGSAHEFAEQCMPVHAPHAWTMHSVYNHTIELDADGIHASGELYNVTHVGFADTQEILAWYGRYLDRYEKRGDEWRIIERVCVRTGDQMMPAPPVDADTSSFRDGNFDRPSRGRPVGP